MNFSLCEFRGGPQDGRIELLPEPTLPIWRFPARSPLPATFICKHHPDEPPKIGVTSDDYQYVGWRPDHNTLVYDYLRTA